MDRCTCRRECICCVRCVFLLSPQMPVIGSVEGKSRTIWLLSELLSHPLYSLFFIKSLQIFFIMALLYVSYIFSISKTSILRVRNQAEVPMFLNRKAATFTILSSKPTQGYSEGGFITFKGGTKVDDNGKDRVSWIQE